MTKPEERGRLIVIALITLLVCPNLVSVVIQLLAASRFPSIREVIGVSVDCIIGWCLYRGYYWARVYIPASLLLVGLAGILATFGAEGWYKISVLINTVLHLGGAIVLWTSPTVGAYFARYGASRAVVLDLDRHDGV